MVDCVRVCGSGMRSRLLSLGAYAVCWQDKMSLAGAQAEGVEAGRLQSDAKRRDPQETAFSGGRATSHALPALSQAEEAVGEARSWLTTILSGEGHGPYWVILRLTGRRWPGFSKPRGALIKAIFNGQKSPS